MKPPDRTGVGGKAWRVTADPLSKAQGETLGSWLLKGNYHPAWNYWQLGVVHLRPIEGVPDAKKEYPEAQHEFMILSLHPDYPPNPDNARSFHILTPADLVYQCNGLTDNQAAAILDQMVRLVLEGKISPDSDYRRAWIAWLDNQVKVARAETA